MPKGNNDSDSQEAAGGGVYRRILNLLINNFTGGHGYKRLPSPKSNFRTNAPGQQEVVIDFRHIEVPENSISHRRSQSTTDALINNRQKSSQEIKVKPGGIQGNRPTRLTVRVEEGKTNGRTVKIEDNENEEKTTTTRTLKSDDELGKLQSIIDQKAEEFLQSRKEAMMRKYSTPKYF